MTDAEVDAVIVGSGPAGATAADVLTSAGWSVVVLEKGRNHLLALDAPFGPLGHVSNDEIKFFRRNFLGPDPFLEPRTYRRDEDDGDRLFAGEVNNLPSTVGGGGFHADGKVPRFRAVDFKARSELGPIDGADIADWPIDYDEMEPYYAEAERVIGVAGLAGANPYAEWRSSEYPMPPGPDMYGAVLTTEAARNLGYAPYPAPTSVNSVPYDGRPACNNCGFCGHYGCPIDAKGDPVAPLRNALRTGKCEIRPECIVERVLLDRSGRRARGVKYLDADGIAHELSARVVVVAGGAWETPRLLLRSEIANSSGLVGRYLMYHFQTFVVGTFPHRLHGHRGRSVTHLHDDHMLIDDDVRAYARAHDLPYFRAGIVEHGGGGGPIMEAIYTRPGVAHTREMLDSAMRDRMWAFTIQGEDLPQVTNRIDLDPRVRDVHGFPAGRATYDVHRHEVVASQYYAPKLEAIMRAAGAEWAFAATSPPLVDGRAGPQAASMSRHIMGTCRMGTDPATSVVDEWQRFHDVENMVCTDSSVFATSTGYGPTLTIVALAIRACRNLAGMAPLSSTPPA
ncbi:MAG TPA: GMC family oxidoreductase [Acidimicrobiia bacterium]|nr:GMC family oxidoreductase [Acidimicrobiia bacterium]